MSAFTAVTLTTICLKFFGCAYFVLLQPYEHTKLESRSRLCRFLGYGIEHNGYQCRDLVSKHLHVSHHLFSSNTRCSPQRLNFILHLPVPLNSLPIPLLNYILKHLITLLMFLYHKINSQFHLPHLLITHLSCPLWFFLSCLPRLTNLHQQLTSFLDTVIG